MGGWGKTCVMSLGCRGKADGKLSHIKWASSCRISLTRRRRNWVKAAGTARKLEMPPPFTKINRAGSQVPRAFLVESVLIKRSSTLSSAGSQLSSPESKFVCHCYCCVVPCFCLFPSVIVMATIIRTTMEKKNYAEIAAELRNNFNL